VPSSPTPHGAERRFQPIRFSRRAWAAIAVAIPCLLLLDPPPGSPVTWAVVAAFSLWVARRGLRMGVVLSPTSLVVLTADTPISL
jgi:hypothetical protein